MEIFLQSLSLLNFKGIRDLAITFDHITNIKGENATGKTSIFDAFTWVPFGKDSKDRKDFEIKPLDINNRTISKIDHEVSAELLVDGNRVHLKRVLREKWVKKRGNSESEFTGNETLYYWNDVPLQQQQYQEKINEIVDENIFKLITNPLYFNSLNWQARRNVLLQLVGDIKDSEVASGNKQFENLLNTISNKSLAEYKREIAVKKKKLNDDLKNIPGRIDEVTRSKPETLDFDALGHLIGDKYTTLASVEGSLISASKANQERLSGITKKQNDLFEQKNLLQKAERDIRKSFADKKNERQNTITELQSSIRNSKSEITSHQSGISSAERRKNLLIDERDQLRGKWEKINAEELVFDANEFVCPACKREFEAENIETKKEEMRTNFNNSKVHRLANISLRGKEINAEVNILDAQIESLTASIASVQETISMGEGMLTALHAENHRLNTTAEDEIQQQVKANAVYKGAEIIIKTLEREIAEATESTDDNSELKEQKAAIASEINELQKQLNTREQIEKADARLQELADEERRLAQQVADLEKTEYAIEQFTKAKMDMLVSRINDRFRFVRFKLFEMQINGGEVETCETLINGVPFSDANNAARINAGLDIINTLCEHYNVYAPIFIDNRESVNALIDCRSQVVNLIVSKDKKLKIEAATEKLVMAG